MLPHTSWGCTVNSESGMQAHAEGKRSRVEMLRIRAKRIPVAVAFAAVFVFGCRDQVTTPFEGQLDISLLAPTLRLPVGTSHQFIAQVTRRNDGTPMQRKVVWKSSNPAVA